MISMSYVSRRNFSPVEVFPIHANVLCMYGYWVDASKYGNDNVTSSWIHVGYSMHNTQYGNKDCRVFKQGVHN